MLLSNDSYTFPLQQGGGVGVPESFVFGGHTNFDGAKHSKDRTSISYPFMDSRQAVNQYSRGILCKKSNNLYDNVGFIGGMINTAACESGGQIPKSASGDTRWDREADNFFIQATESAEIFDLGGQSDWFDFQEKIFIEHDKSGDVGIILVGEGAFPQIALRESHQIANSRQPDRAGFDQSKWDQGLLLDRNNRIQQFRFPDGARHVDLERRDVIFFANIERIRQRRGLPATYRLLNKMQDVNDIQQFMTAGVKSRNAVAMVWEGLTAGSEVSSIGDSLNQRQTSSSDSSERLANLNRDEVITGTTIPRAPKGAELKFLMDDRPGQNQVEYMDYILRDMAWGYNVPLEVVWNLAALSSANTRTVLRAYNAFINKRRRWFKTRVGARLRNWIIAKGIQQGRIGMPVGGMWWKHNWIGGPLATADFARDMRAMLDALNRGEISEDEFSGWRGVDREIMDENHVRAVKERIALCEAHGVPFDYAYPKAPGTQVDWAAFQDQLDTSQL